MSADLWLELLAKLDSDLLADVVAVVAWFAAAFCIGAGWAAYRAIGWTDRMRAWAYSVQAGGPITDSCIANAEIDGMGLE